MEKKFILLNDVKPSIIERIPSKIDELDWLYGYTYKTNNYNRYEWGIPYGKISLWAGESGSGKSRLATYLARHIAVENYEVVKGFSMWGKVLYFQNEVDLNTFGGWIKPNKNNYSEFALSKIFDEQESRNALLKNLIISDACTLNDQLEVIRETKPYFIIIDSINMLKEYGSGSEKNVKIIIDGDENQKGYRHIYSGTDGFNYYPKVYSPHILFLSQLNKEGEARGSSVLIHLVDTVFNLEKGPDNDFFFKVGNKHRYGRTGSQFFSVWKHKDSGVECISKNRYEDNFWLKANNVPVTYNVIVKYEGQEIQVGTINGLGKSDEEIKKLTEKMKQKFIVDLDKAQKKQNKINNIKTVLSWLFTRN
jgi:predicted ATP-dependent serine protease